MSTDNNSLRYFIQKVGIVLFVLLLLLFFRYASQVILILFASTMLAILWRGVAHWLHKKTNLKKSIALAIVIIVQFGLIVLMFVLLSPKITEQVEVLAEDLPKTINKIVENFSQTNVGKRLFKEIPEDGEGIVNNPENLLMSIMGFFTATIGVVLDFLVILIIAIFLCISPSMYTDGFIRLVPIDKRKRAKEILMTLDYTLFRWFVGKIIDMFFVGVLTAIGLYIIDIPLVLTFALLAFFLSFIPNIGPVLAAIPPILIAAMEEPQKALYVGLLYLGVQMFESAVITPTIQKKAILMPPVLLLLVQLFFAIILGPLGLILATPILAVLIILVKTLYVEDTLGDETMDVKGEKKI